MLVHTFCHVPGLGALTERKLWDAGIDSWHAVARGDRLPLSPKRSELVRHCARTSIDQLALGNADYFYPLLPTKQQWRLFPEFRDSIAYLDIETTGLGSPGDYITTIVLYDGRGLYHYVQGDNLTDFCEQIQRYKLLVTYNGKTFDAPFIRNHLKAPMDQAHIDLRYVLASLGYRGGLKGCEQQLGIARGDLAEVDGYFAVLLWHDFHRGGNPCALETLLAYNALDVVNLEALMVLAYNRLAEQTPFFDRCLIEPPCSPKIPFTADHDTIQRLKQIHTW